MSMREAIGLNFVRPDAGRPGNYTFREQGEFLAEQYEKMGLVWNRMAFSWVLIEPEEGVFDFSVYDRNVRACLARGQKLLATFGGHFDAPPRARLGRDLPQGRHRPESRAL